MTKTNSSPTTSQSPTRAWRILDRTLRLIATPQQRRLARYRALADRILALDSELQALSDDALLATCGPVAPSGPCRRLARHPDHPDLRAGARGGAPRARRSPCRRTADRRARAARRRHRRDEDRRRQDADRDAGLRPPRAGRPRRASRRAERLSRRARRRLDAAGLRRARLQRRADHRRTSTTTPAAPPTPATSPTASPASSASIFCATI